MNISMPYWVAKIFVKMFGWEAFLLMLQSKFPTYKLYSVSQSWFYEGAQYICKLRGEYGDVIIEWLSR